MAKTHGPAVSDRALVFYAHPLIFIEAARLLERLLPLIHATDSRRRILLHGDIPAALADDLASWGAEMTDIEEDREHDVSEEGMG